MPPPEQRRAFPDATHEELARWVEENFAEIDTARADTADSLYLVDVAFTLLDTVETKRGQLQTRVTALEAKVAALEALTV